MIAMLEPAKGAVMFDLTLHGVGQKYDLAKLLLEPPFLALTLSVLAAAVLAFLHGLGRFGPPRSRPGRLPSASGRWSTPQRCS